VQRSKTLQSYVLNFNLIKQEETAVVIRQTSIACRTLQHIAIKRCKINEKVFGAMMKDGEDLS